MTPSLPRAPQVERIYIQFADNGSIRKWQHEPFDGGAEYVAASSDPAPTGIHGPFGWLNGLRGLSEDSWSVEGVPLTNNEEYFSIPLYALVDPFKEAGKDPTPTAEAGGVTVKELEWEKGVVDWAKPLPGMKYVSCSTSPAGSWAWWLEEAPETRSVHTTEAEAKAAAQADYERRILSALRQSKPQALPGQFAERVVAACRAYMNTYDVLAVDVREHMQVNMADALRASDAVLAAAPPPSSEAVGPYTAFQSEIDPQVWYVGDDHVAFLRTEIGVGNAERIARLAAAGMNAASSSEAPGWRPIETAPHGVEVLLATPPFKCMGEQARWEMRVGCASWGERIGGFSNRSRDAYATHWLPLPSAPVSDGGAE